EVVLLGSIATGKYVEPLLAVLGERLRFPADFVGRGDMSRGGLLLRCARAGAERTYAGRRQTVRPRPPAPHPRRAPRPRPPRPPPAPSPAAGPSVTAGPMSPARAKRARATRATRR